MKESEITETMDSKNSLKMREQLYRLIIRDQINDTFIECNERFDQGQILQSNKMFYVHAAPRTNDLHNVLFPNSQLFYDGFQSLAVSLSSAVQAHPTCPPSDRLSHLVNIGLQNEHMLKRTMNKAEILLGPGLDLEYETDVQTSAPEPALYETAYVTSHKAQCRSGAFSPDGQLVATGSVDASIKILDVDRMLAKSSPDAGEMGADQQGHPVIRTLYDHVEEVTCLEFHPRESILASGSRDNTVKLFDFSKAAAKKAFRTLTDADQIRCMSFHPSGDFLVVGTNQTVIRLYDINTAQCYVCSFPSHFHADGITSLKYSFDGKLYTSGSRDGSIKLWDGISSKCVGTISKAHDGAPVGSVTFSRSGKYVLSSGMDSTVRLWELSSLRNIITYTGAGTMGKQEHRVQAIFNHSEDFVMFPDEATTSLCCWDARSANRKQLLSLGHNGAVRCIVHAPSTAAFLTCSDDYRARFWYRRAPH